MAREPAAILIVEDNRDAAESLAMLLEVLGHRVRLVHDGTAALDALRAESWDVALVDIGLPGIDGYELARRARALADGDRLMLVAVTGYGREEDRARASAAGFDHHLVKPIDVDALKRLLRELASRSGGGGTAAS
jgi:CheY-like chemotaxis protein